MKIYRLDDFQGGVKSLDCHAMVKSNETIVLNHHVNALVDVYELPLLWKKHAHE